MELDYIFALISIIFFITMIVFYFKRPKFMNKLESMLVCLLGCLLYGFLCGDYYASSKYRFESSALSAVFGMVGEIFLVALIYVSFSEIKCMEKWQAIVISLFGFLFYEALSGVCYGIIK
ncbi:hypothetical protein [Clostridium sp. JN-1]|uniref:hypothetical protein n=1 Tax=Clostridium sp. JN-1 TaxID=2483110 RepID=UPI000F0B8D5C|nr:hypothetical protein [Clostridium sp. JN-1]